jgi:hypothetical protein
MIRRWSLFCLVSITALFATSAAQAFQLENDPKDLPKFDFDEQLRQFRNSPQPQLDASAAAKGYQTPYGTLQFGVTRGAVSPFGTPFGGTQFRSSGNADRRHFERLFVHPDLQHRYD